jgi:hypothetical protein
MYVTEVLGAPTSRTAQWLNNDNGNYVREAQIVALSRQEIGAQL